VAWLGPAGHDGEVTIEVIQDIAIKIKDIEEDEMRYMGSSELKRLGVDVNQINWPYIWTFLNRPYWRRIWVVQELASYNAHGGLSEDSDMSIIMRVSRYMLKVELERFVKLLILLSFHKGNKFDVDYGCSMMEPLQFFVTFGHTSAERMFFMYHDCYDLDGLLGIATYF
jgi:hypothetical protein